MNNIQKAFKTKSKLRGMADGGQVDPRVLGSGMAQRAGSALQGRRAQLDAAIDAASGAPPPRSAPTPVTAAPAKKPEEKSALRSFFGFADGGQIYKNDVGGVPTFTDARAATAGAKAYTPGQGGGTFSVVGMEPAQKQQMAEAAARREAAANAPTTLGGRLDAALGKLSSPLATAGAPSSTPTLGSELDAAIGRTQGVTSAQTPATGAPANDVNRIMNSRDMSIFTPQEMKTFNGMGQAAMADAAQMQDVGLKAGQQATDMGLSAATQPQFAPPVDDMGPPELELADGGKVKGKGGPTDDKVGPVALSDGEYVLPADTVEIVGRDKLDALRLATHDFVDDSNKPKVSGLRKMANGGTFYVDPEGVASRQMPPGRAVAPYQPPPAPSTAMAPRAPQVIDAEFRNVSGAAGAANPAATSSLRTAINSGGGRVAGFIRGSLPVAAIGGALDSVTDVGSGYRDKFNESIGATGPVSSVAGDTARVMGNVGDAITFGLAGRLGRGLSSIGTPEGFSGGFMSESDRDKYNREQMQRVMGQQAPAAAPQSRSGELPGMSNVPADVRTSSAGMPATPVQPQSYQSRRLAEMGVPVDQQNLAPVTDDTRRSLLREGGGTPGQYVNLGSYGGDANIYGTASKPGGRIDSFTGVGASSRPGGSGPQEDPIMGEIRSALRGLTDGAGSRGGGASIGSGNSRDINERYDKLAKQLSGMYSSKGQGNLARRLLELEQSRSNALDADARNQSALRGQDMSASTAANSANMQARMQALQTLGTMANQRSTQIAQAQAAQLKALQDAQAQSEKRMEDSAKVFESVADTFAAGDKEAQAQYRELLSTLPPELHAVAQGLAPEDKRAFYTNIVRQQLGRNEGLVLGRDAGATAQNAVVGGLIGRMTRFAGGARGKAVDRMLGKIPRVGPVLSALRPVENLARFGTLIGAAGGAYATPEVENLTRWDPVARDPETGAALPARKDIREAATYGVFDTYLNPFDDSVQAVSGRRTNKPTPDEEEAARRFRSALRN